HALHARAPQLDPPRRQGGGAPGTPAGDPGQRAQPAVPARGLRVPPPLPLRPREVQGRHPTARGHRWWSPGALRQMGRARPEVGDHGMTSEVRTTSATHSGMASHSAGGNLLEVKNLRKYFPIRGGILSRVVANVKAVEDVSFNIKPGEVVGLVGESGSGKTTVGRAILRLIEPSAGEVLFDGVDVTKLSKTSMREYRRKMQIIFQDPFASLNPRMSVGDIIGEAMTIHNLARGKDREQKVAALLEIGRAHV